MCPVESATSFCQSFSGGVCLCVCAVSHKFLNLEKTTCMFRSPVFELFLSEMTNKVMNKYIKRR